MTGSDTGLPETVGSVLIVDDERGPRDAIRLALEPRFRAIIAASGEEALRMFRRQQVDVVTLDLQMPPGLDGIETFRRIRELDSEVQIIFVSARSLEDSAHTLPPAAYAWIAKPFETKRLLGTVERAAEETRSGRLRAGSIPRSGAAECTAAVQGGKRMGGRRVHGSSRTTSRSI